MRKLKTQENIRFRVNTDNDIDLEAQEIKQPTQRIQRIELDKKEYNALRSHNNYKKIVYHGQIKRKRNIQQNQIMISSSKENKEQFNKINPQNYTNEQNNQNINY